MLRIRPSLHFFNTLSRRKESFSPLDGKTVHLYTCGPTVYNYAHIGNLRTYLFEDLLKRTLKFFGYEVLHVMNLTDVDDKTIRGANALGIPLNDFTEPFIQAFHQDLKVLNIQPADFYPKATEYFAEMIGIIQKLIDKKVAYKGIDGSIYYSIRAFKDYGKLSHLHLNELKAGASDRVEADEYDKDNVSDFVLWKHYDATRDGPIYWESPFGPGRPGWHIECSAMASKILGETIDIHCGGVDNIFPHHENEIAQCEACYSKPFSRYWMHSEHLLVDNKKMSKSLGNFFTLRDLLEKGFKGSHIRFLLLSTHYKHQLNFTLESLKGAASALERLEDFIQRIKSLPEGSGKVDIDLILTEARDAFERGLADDLNLSLGLGKLFEMVREVNALCDQEALGHLQGQKILHFLEEIDQILGFIPFEREEVTVPKEIELALLKREEARKNKQYKEADTYRDFILNSGYFIEDTPQGPKVKKK